MPDLTTLPIGQRLRTRDGRSARLLANDVKGIASCVIAVEVGSDMEQLHNVDADGVISEGSEHPHDVVGIWRDRHRVRIIVWDGGRRVTAYGAREYCSDQTVAQFRDVVADRIVEIEETGNAR